LQKPRRLQKLRWAQAVLFELEQASMKRRKLTLTSPNIQRLRDAPCELGAPNTSQIVENMSVQPDEMERRHASAVDVRQAVHSQ